MTINSSKSSSSALFCWFLILLCFSNALILASSVQYANGDLQEKCQNSGDKKESHLTQPTVESHDYHLPSTNVLPTDPDQEFQEKCQNSGGKKESQLKQPTVESLDYHLLSTNVLPTDPDQELQEKCQNSGGKKLCDAEFIDDLSFFFRVLGLLSAIVSATGHFLKMLDSVKEDTVKNLSPDPFLLSFFQILMWWIYGSPAFKNDPFTLATANTIVLVLNTVYLIVLLKWSRGVRLRYIFSRALYYSLPLPCSS